MSPSLLLSLCSKPSLRNLALRSSHTFGSRMFSSNPYLLQCVTFSGEDVYPEAGAMTGLLMVDPAKEEKLYVEGKPYPKELLTSRLVGSSHGWGVFLSAPDSILISDYCHHPSTSKSNPKFIPMHPRDITNGCQNELVSGFAMSSSPDKQGCVTAVNYTGRMLSVGPPDLDIREEGINVFTPPSFFNYFEHSMIMYSKRYQKFYMVSSGGHHLWSWDGLPSCLPSTMCQFHELRFHSLPQFSHSELQLLNSCYRTQQLVESPSGQRFLVKWYAQSLPTKRITLDGNGTKRFMVFREEEEDMSMSYTQDIGDLCMFLGSNEPFCLKASSFPGLKPNSIYFVGDDRSSGVYDIANRTISALCPNCPSPLPEGQHNLVPCWEPHWIPPYPL